MRTRWSAYAGVSVALAGGVVVKALAQRPNFYSAAVYLSQSNANLMIMINVSFVAACTFLLGLQKLLYGPLRPIEIEQLYEKAWFAITETCLAMTIFRGEIGPWFLVMFFALLAGKVWAWIGEGRVEILEQQPPRDPRLFHTRLTLSLGLSVIFNLMMLEYVVSEVMQMPRPDMMVMFGFEFAILSIVSLSTAARYAINLSEMAIVQKQKARRIADIRKERVQAAVRAALHGSAANESGAAEQSQEEPNQQPPEELQAARAAAMTAAQEAVRQPIDESEVDVEGWEGKGRWMFYLDLTTDFCKLSVYLSFFIILLIFYGLPIHILRDVFMTARSFFKRIADFIKYRNATRDMNARYADATAQDMTRGDVCIICREEMRPYEPAPDGQTNPVAERMRPKKLPCGHVLHLSCLRSWLERQQICPTCRTSVTPAGQTETAQPGTGAGQAPAGQHPPGANGGPGGAGGRAGVVRLGPLRIAFGAARGNNMLGDLQNQLRAGADQPAQPAQPALPANAPQQYGFGIRWEGMRRAERSGGPRTIQDQLNAAERQIQQELTSLGGSLAELHVLRNMEAELARLRAQRSALGMAQAQPVPVFRSGAPSIQNTPAQTQLTGDPAARLNAGHPDLPAGLVLPEGWTMMPLAPANNGNAPHPHIPIGTHMMPQQMAGPFPAFPVPTPTQPLPMPSQPSDQATATLVQPSIVGMNGQTLSRTASQPASDGMQTGHTDTVTTHAATPVLAANPSTDDTSATARSSPLPGVLPRWGSSIPAATASPPTRSSLDNLHSGTGSGSEDNGTLKAESRPSQSDTVTSDDSASTASSESDSIPEPNGRHVTVEDISDDSE